MCPDDQQNERYDKQVSGLIFFPRDTLTFSLSPTTPAQAVLRISNQNTESVIFKVKTTTPERYLVKPNHGLIRQGGHTDVTVIIVQAEKKEILAKASTHQRIESKDKFLVQSSSINTSRYAYLTTRNSQEVANAITEQFSLLDRKRIHSKKLFVEFYLKDLAESEGHVCDEAPEVREPCLPVTQKLASSFGPIPGSPEAMFAEIVALRRKYDDLVSFTVNLAAERDSLSAELEMVRSEKRNATEVGKGLSDPAVQSTGDIVVRSFLFPSFVTQFVLLPLVAFMLGWFSISALQR